MPKFIKNIIKDFLNIYVHVEGDQRDRRYKRSGIFGIESHGDEFVTDPVTGKKKISFHKVLVRAVIVLIILIILIILFRVITHSGSWR
ncbi:MAG: hypothetical protein FWF92_10015 [Oscillospiraceae bacterium]|nr:hypothetical protein [Oscillospiraceae bacterium]